MKLRKWVMVKQFDGFRKESDIQSFEEEIPELQDGEVLFEAVYLSIDPYMRPYMARTEEGTTMIGQQVAKVAATRNGEFPIGSLYLLSCGWRSHYTYKPSIPEADAVYGKTVPVPVPDISPLSNSYLLGCVGMPGITAYFGLLRILDPKPGETVFVNTAAGAVGSVVAQIAKIKVGGDMTATVTKNHMNAYGRIAICGNISSYHDTEAAIGPYTYSDILFKQLKVQGFLVTRWLSEWPEARNNLSRWVKEGNIKVSEHITEGFENMPKAFLGLLRGANNGKALVKV